MIDLKNFRIKKEGVKSFSPLYTNNNTALLRYQKN